jgi:hypothetical protein
MIYQRIPAKKINALHGLFLFLHRLKVIGTINTKTISSPMTEFGKPSLYSVVYEGYNRSTRGVISPEDRLREFFNRVHDPEDSSCNEQ